MYKIIQQVFVHEPHGNALISETFYRVPQYGFMTFYYQGWMPEIGKKQLKLSTRTQTVLAVNMLQIWVNASLFKNCFSKYSCKNRTLFLFIALLKKKIDITLHAVIVLHDLSLTSCINQKARQSVDCEMKSQHSHTFTTEII